MRLLAYGGTRYAERVRVGSWPESLGSESSDFEDTFDIPTGQGLLSYGVGILDGAPVLILRERQNEADRGGYPYTLLLDPGADVWRRHDWNPPLLAASLRLDEDLWHRLMIEPQRLSSADLIESRLTSIQPARVDRDSALDAGAAMAATLEGDGLYFPISILGVTTRPPLETMAAALAALPEPVRIGGGWMVGGGRNGRRTFGCRAVFDDVSPAAEPDAHARDALDAGTRLLRLMGDVSARISPEVSGVFAAPAHAWSTPPGTLSTALRTASAAAIGDVDETTTDEIAAFIGGTTPYGAAVLDVWKHALQSQEHVSPAVSRVFLKHDWDRIDASLGSRLSADAIGEAFHVRRITPAASETERFDLPPDRQAGVWASLVSRAAQADEAVGLAGDAVVRLQGHSPDLLAPIVTAALERTVELQGTLGAWASLRGRADVWPAVREAVAAAARAGVGTGDARWHIDYLLFAEDPGGAWLATERPDAVPAVIAALLDEIAGGTYADDASSWLGALASTPARAHVSTVFDNTDAPLESDRELAIDLLAAAEASQPLRALIAESLTAASGDGQKSGRLIGLMARDPVLIANILGWVDAHVGGTLLESAAETDAAAVASLIEVFVSHVSECHPPASTGAIQALQDFLGRSSPAVRAVRDRAGRSLFGPDAIYLPAYLEELCRSVESNTPLEAHASGASVMRRVRDWLGARRH
jgi:hypothetical protein